MSRGNKISQFEVMILVHLDAAYNLARWLMRNEHDAEDVVQEAASKAFKYFESFHGDHGKAWFLSIVRNTCYNRFQQHRLQSLTTSLDEGEDEEQTQYADTADGPEATLIKMQNIAQLDHAIAALPIEFREILVLRELEDLSYKVIADVAGIPIGTVMSRLSRARSLLRQALLDLGQEPS